MQANREIGFTDFHQHPLPAPVRKTEHEVRMAIERVSVKIDARIDRMPHSHGILTKAIEKGLLRRPGP